MPSFLNARPTLTRLYIKIFFGFWLITASMIVGTNMVIHWFDLSSEKSLAQVTRDRTSAPAKRLLHQATAAAVNYNQLETKLALANMPPWASRHLYVITPNNQDLINRRIPAEIAQFLPTLNGDNPIGKTVVNHHKIYGRLVRLADGLPVKIITISLPGVHSEEDVIWQLFLDHIWPLLLVSILISGTACFFLARRMASGIQTLKYATEEIARGDFSVRITPLFKGRSDEITELGQAFDRMTERLEKAMLEQKRLIKDVSHELRSPLARLQIALGLAQQRSQGTVDKELERIKQAAEYLNDVISDILSLPVHDQAGWALNDMVDVSPLLEAVVEHNIDNARDKDVQLKLNLPDGEHLVASHGNTLIGVFENIVRNALHYTPRSSAIGIDLRSACTPSRRGRKQTGQLIVEVCDQGSGVNEEDLEAIFEPFYRTSEARDRSTGGYGLGLAIAKRTIALHGGTIEAENLTSGGLCIRVTLPLDLDNHNEHDEF